MNKIVLGQVPEISALNCSIPFFAGQNRRKGGMLSSQSAQIINGGLLRCKDIPGQRRGAQHQSSPGCLLINDCLCSASVLWRGPGATQDGSTWQPEECFPSPSPSPSPLIPLLSPFPSPAFFFFNISPPALLLSGDGSLMVAQPLSPLRGRHMTFPSHAFDRGYCVHYSFYSSLLTLCRLEELTHPPRRLSCAMFCAGVSPLTCGH